MLQKFDQRNRDLMVNINGQLVHRDQAGISPFDSAVQGGDAVWEGLRLYNSRIFKLHEHLDRLERSASALSFTEIPPREKIIEEIKRTLAANKMRDGVHIRLTLTRGLKITSGMDPRLNQSGPTLIVLAEHKPPVYAKSGLALITSKIRRPPPEVLDARRFWQRSKRTTPARTMRSCWTRAVLSPRRTPRTSSLCATPINREQAVIWRPAVAWRVRKELPARR